MKPWYDLTQEPALQNFPWEPVYKGLANSNKTVTTFYGDVHSVEHTDTLGQFPDRNAWRWYNALKHGAKIEGFNVNLSYFTGEFWWARMHERDIWKPSINARHFTELYDWISKSGIFEHTGRITFFVQLDNQRSPDHTDFDPLKVPQHLSGPSNFLWLTPKENPKRFFVNGEQMPWACWFNHFVPHGTEAADRPQWSLRIDGKFSEQFKQRNNLP